MAKQQSFADKATKKKQKDLSTYVKYIKSVKSDKTGYWRFNEQMIQLKDGENLDGALKRMDELAHVLNTEMPDVESVADDNVMKEKSEDIIAEESVVEGNEPIGEENQDEVKKTDGVSEHDSKEQLDEKPAPKTDGQESDAKKADKANVEKVNDADEIVEAATDDDDKVNDKKVDSADVSEKDTAAKSDESA